MIKIRRQGRPRNWATTTKPIISKLTVHFTLTFNYKWAGIPSCINHIFQASRGNSFNSSDKVCQKLENLQFTTWSNIGTNQSVKEIPAQTWSENLCCIQTWHEGLRTSKRGYHGNINSIPTKWCFISEWNWSEEFFGSEGIFGREFGLGRILFSNQVHISFLFLLSPESRVCTLWIW